MKTGYPQIQMKFCDKSTFSLWRRYWCSLANFIELYFLFLIVSFRLYQQILKTIENYIKGKHTHDGISHWSIKLEFYLEHKYTDKYEAKTADKDENIIV